MQAEGGTESVIAEEASSSWVFRDGREVESEVFSSLGRRCGGEGNSSGM